MADINTGTTNGSAQPQEVIAESEFSYELPDNTDDFNLRDAEKEFLADIANENFADEPVEPEDGVPVDDGAEIPVEPVAGQADEPDEPEIDPKYARGIERVVQRELAAKAEREAADKSIAEMKALKEELSKYKDYKSVAELSAMMDLDPVGGLKALGKDPQTIMKLVLAQELGDSAPPQLKEFAKKAADDLRYARLEAKLAQKEQAERATTYFNTVQAGAKSYVGSLGADIDPKRPGKKVGDSIPTLSLVAKADPDWAQNEIMEEIVQEARRKAAEDPNGEPLSYEEAAKRVESRFSKLAKILVPNGTTAAKIGLKPKPVIPPTVKPANKPIAPWQKKNSSIEEDGLKEALREYERAEAERKARR